MSSHRLTHGMSSHGPFFHKTWNSWRGMKERCSNPNFIHYHKYGGRGIKFCDRWSDFKHFLADMGLCPVGCSLDRFPNKNGNYEPGNCRWATYEEQANNTQYNVVLTHDGKTMTLAEWARHLNLNYWTVQARYKRHYPVEKILSEKLFKKGHARAA
jgi:hypothetical protein